LGAWSQQLPVHPAALIIPEFGRDALIKLGDSIKADGMLIPVVILVETDADGHKPVRLLDGISRLDGMELVGIPFTIEWDTDGLPHIAASGYSFPNPNVIIADKEFDAYRYTAAVNIARRQLTQQQRLAYVDRLLTERPDLTARAIAKMAGVHNETVDAHRGEAKANDGSVISERVEQSGRRARGRKPASSELSDVEESAARRKAEAARIEAQQVDNVVKNAHFMPPAESPPADSKPGGTAIARTKAWWRSATRGERADLLRWIGSAELLEVMPEAWLNDVRAWIRAAPAPRGTLGDASARAMAAAPTKH
jgi:ParB-like chromosome segregation protein Spo0J